MRRTIVLSGRRTNPPILWVCCLTQPRMEVPHVTASKCIALVSTRSRPVQVN
jgi:hypothetical protein